MRQFEVLHLQEVGTERESWRVQDGDGRLIATCYDDDDAEYVAEALNAYEASRDA